MNTNQQQTELLLMMHTRFFSKQLEKVNRIDARDWYSKREQLIEACWEGLTSEILPECFVEGNQAELWEIIDGNNYLDLEFCEGRIKKDKHHSLNPYVFMQVQGLN
ncbi:MAG: hypothetical protein IPJ02_03445 [Chitinophagaceae bacterium]|jgi:hypothetical protein|nr:hypothetical protein [Chitinophagaceae bacterium]